MSSSPDRAKALPASKSGMAAGLSEYNFVLLILLGDDNVADGVVDVVDSVNADADVDKSESEKRK